MSTVDAAPRRALLSAVAVLLVLVTAGCAGGGRSGSDQPGVEQQPSTAPGPAGDAQRISIASASESDIASALRANGVDDPERWAQIVLQYRPYPAGPAGMAKLKDALTRFQATPDDISKITNALTA